MSGRSPTWPRAVVFDLDGTLADTAEDIAASLNHVMQQAQLAPLPAAETRGLIGGGSEALLRKAFALRGVQLDAAHLAPWHGVFTEHYVGSGFPHSVPYPGVEELLARLHRDGVRLAVCTNKAEHLTLSLMDSMHLRGSFDVISGGRSDRPQKPSPQPLLEVVAALGVLPQQAVMVGDSAADIACARAAGIASIGVTFGYTNVPMAQLGADAIIDDFAGFAAACAELPTAAGLV